MKLSSLLLPLALGFSCHMASAQTIDCPDVGTFLPNGDELVITYSPTMRFGDNTDTASFVIMDQVNSVYVANKWGARIEIPNAMLSGQMAVGQVTFTLPETSDMVVTCTVE